jgi:hypothetical protein
MKKLLNAPRIFGLNMDGPLIAIWLSGSKRSNSCALLCKKHRSKIPSLPHRMDEQQRSRRVQLLAPRSKPVHPQHPLHPKPRQRELIQVLAPTLQHPSLNGNEREEFAVSKTKKDLLCAIAKKIGGERGKCMRKVLRRTMPFKSLLELPISDKEFSAELNKMESNLLKAFARLEQAPRGKTGSWGSSI